MTPIVGFFFFTSIIFWGGGTTIQFCLGHPFGQQRPCFWRPEFESWLEDLSRSRPHLSPTSLPVSSNLSYHNKGKNAKNISLKKVPYWSNDKKLTVCRGQFALLFTIAPLVAMTMQHILKKYVLCLCFEKQHQACLAWNFCIRVLV